MPPVMGAAQGCRRRNQPRRRGGVAVGPAVGLEICDPGLGGPAVVVAAGARRCPEPRGGEGGGVSGGAAATGTGGGTRGGNGGTTGGAAGGGGEGEPVSGVLSDFDNQRCPRED